MALEINEAMMEMHFHRAIVNHFRSTFGANFLRLFKPTQRREAWVGFDQGWMRTELSQAQLFESLRNAVQRGVNSVDNFYVGYFLQFKIVERIRRRSKHMPTQYRPPYLRSELSLYPNALTQLSQHETLLRLSNIANASVAYACAMFFEPEEIYEEVDLTRLRCVPLDTAPSGWATNQRHFIAFQGPLDHVPLWCSRQKEGKAFSFADWASPQGGGGLNKLSGQQAIGLIEESTATLLPPVEETERMLLTAYEEPFEKRPKELTGIERQFREERQNVMPESFTLMEFNRGSVRKR